MDSIKKTKIIATLGPTSSNEYIIGKLIDEGANYFRINFSHGSLDDHKANIKLIREIARTKGKIIGILADLQGPKIRVGEIEGGQIELKRNSNITITTRDLIIGNNKVINASYRGLINLKAKDKLLLDDGLLSLEVISVDKNKQNILCKVIEGGILKSKKGINLPYVDIDIPPLTSKDKECALFALGQEVDYFALSFIRNAYDITPLRELIKKEGKTVPIIAKIERPEAIDNIEQIIEKADGIMIARGDLGVEIPLEKVPLLQKSIILKANRMNKPVITATQMLESMILHPRATRAEVSDVANAILDGTDAVMLSGETAVGKHPIASVRTMNTIALEIENSSKSLYNRKHGMDKVPDNDIEESIAIASCQIANNLNAKAITINSDNSAYIQLLSKFHPICPIIAIVSNKYIAQKISLYWEVIPVLIARKVNKDEKIEITNRIIKDKDKIIVLIETTGKKMNAIKIL